ncbi:MAG: glycosyltransferase family 4 protein [Candidatus Omnitrophica bacterium]|nr:glycosyltransferase family 4 protein [Candidatus Omnitrophota bacterium]
MKICIIFPFDPLGQKIGGAETFLKDFIKYVPREFDLEVIGTSADKIQRPAGKWQSLNIEGRDFSFFPVFCEKDENRRTRIPLSLRFTWTLMFRRLDYSERIIFFNRIEPAVLFKHVKAPKILMVHNDIARQIMNRNSGIVWSAFPAFYFMVERYIFTFVDRVYTVSTNTLDFYKKKYPKNKNKFYFLPTWVDDKLFCPSGEPKTEIKKKLRAIDGALVCEKKWILYVGRLQEQKAPLRLIDSFNEYHRHDENSLFVVIGGGGLRKSTEEYVKKLALEKSVIFLGDIEQRRLMQLYRASDVFLLTSNFEGMPICVLEALACGIPVVSTSVGEVKRVVINGFSGEVVEDFSPKTIARELAKVLNNAGSYTQGNCASAIKNYTPQNVLNPFFEYIRRTFK